VRNGKYTEAGHEARLAFEQEFFSMSRKHPRQHEQRHNRKTAIAYHSDAASTPPGPPSCSHKLHQKDLLTPKADDVTLVQGEQQGGPELVIDS
jgi:hypothetical protein